MNHLATRKFIDLTIKPLAFVALIIFGAIFGQFVFFDNSVSALSEAEQQQCMAALNGTRDSALSDADKQLYNSKCSTAVGGICTAKTDLIASGTGSIVVVYYTCTPVIDAGALHAEQEEAVRQIYVQAAINGACDNLPAPEKPNCTTKVRNAAIGCLNSFFEKGYEDSSINFPDISVAVVGGCIANATGYSQSRIESALLEAKDEAKEKSDDIARRAGGTLGQECVDRGGIWKEGENGSLGTCDEKTAGTLCSGGPLGWIMCPLAELAVSITSSFAALISDMLTFAPLLNSAQGDAIQKVWQLIVNIANILLVIAFLFVVFSQATSIGLSNYGIKKMLPKIIAAAILMNLSFFICAVGVDIANILGQSVAGIIQVGIDALPDPSTAGLADIKTGSSTSDKIILFGMLSAIGIPTLIIAPGLIYFALPAVLSAAAAMFTAFAVIIFRQVALVIMIIISPLAFVAWVLPNTESWFEKWRKFFVALLVMFPLIMAIFYGSAFLSNIMLITLDPSKPGTDINIVKIMALFVLVLPLFALPFVMKMAGGILERFGAIVNDRQKGLIDRSRNWAAKNSKRVNANQRARLATAGENWGKDGERHWGRNADGSKMAGLKARLARTAGSVARGTASTANFAGGYADRRDYRHGEQERNAKRIQDEEIYKRLGAIDQETGRATASAEQFARRAAGVGGARNAERIMQLSREAQTNEFVAERKRAINDLDNSGLYAPGSNYSVWSEERKRWIDIGADTGGGAHALSLGKKVRITNAAGQMREFGGFDSGGMIAKAAIEMATSNSDGSAITRMQGLKTAAYMDTSDIARVNNEGSGVADGLLDSLNQSMGANAPKNAAKFQSLYSGPDALNGAGDETIAQWHGGQWLIAGHQINYLRDAAQEAMARATTADDRTAAQKQIDDAEAYATKIKAEFDEVRTGKSRMSGLYSKGKEEAFQAFQKLVDEYPTAGRAPQYDHLFKGGGIR